jgi:hypothetical protein
MDFPADSIVLAGRAYVDFNRMREMDEAGGWFVIRGKEHIRVHVEERPLNKEKV